MIRVLYFLVLLSMVPSSLLAGKWDGYYLYGENSKYAYTVKNDKIEMGCSNTQNNVEIKSKKVFKITQKGKAVANCGDYFILLDFKNMTFRHEYRNKITNFKFTKKIPLKSVPKKSAKPSYKDPVATVFKSLSLKTRKDIQKTLKEKGLYTSSIDGLYGNITRKAIEDYFNSGNVFLRVPKNYSELDLFAELKIIANLQKVPKPLVDKIIVVEKDIDKPMNEDEARFLLSQLVQYSQDNPGAFDLDFAVEFNKVREITEGLWSYQLSKNFERFRGYLAKFPDFITYVEAEKKIAEEKLKKKVASLRTELKKNVIILEEWARKNVLDEKAAQIAALSSRIEQTSNQTIEKLEKMIEGSKRLLSATGIEDKLKSAETTEAINSLYNPSSIYLFANISGDGQNIYKNLESKFAFENNRSTYCHSDKLTPFEHYLIKMDIADKFATLESIDKTECSSSTDLLIVKGNEITSDALRSTRGFWIIPVLKMEQVEVITELTRSQRDDKFGQLSFMKSSIKKDVMDGTRVGYGLIRVADKGDTICSVLQTQIEGHQNTLRQQGLLLNVFGLKASIDTNTSTEEDVFRMLQRGKCGVIYGSSLSLGRVYLAANSAGFEVEFLPLWIGQRTIDSESDRIEQAKLNAKQQQEQSKRNLEDQARLNAQAERTRKENAMEKQRMMRESNGLRFKVLSDLLKAEAFNAIDFAFENSPLDSGYVKKYIDQPFVDKDTRYSLFDPIIADVQQLASEKWEITEKRIDQIDFGKVAFSERDLEGIILEVTVSSKNRLVGKYSEYCKRVHVIYDKDFEVWRKFQLSECQQDMVSNQWRGSNDFESKWIVN